MLVELSVMEQRYQAVLAVTQDGWRVVEVAHRMGVSRQTVQLDRPLRIVRGDSLVDPQRVEMTVSRPSGFRALRGWKAAVLIVVAVVAVLVAIPVGLVAWTLVTNYSPDQIPSDALLPLPGTLVLANKSESSCGNGYDFECGRVFVVRSRRDADSARAVMNSVKDHLAEQGGWHLDDNGSDCQRRGHFCVDVAPFSERWDYAPGSEDEDFSAQVFGIDTSEVPSLKSNAVWISFSDCC